MITATQRLDHLGEQTWPPVDRVVRRCEVVGVHDRSSVGGCREALGEGRLSGAPGTIDRNQTNRTGEPQDLRHERLDVDARFSHGRNRIQSRQQVEAIYSATKSMSCSTAPTSSGRRSANVFT